MQIEQHRLSAPEDQQQDDYTRPGYYETQTADPDRLRPSMMRRRADGARESPRLIGESGPRG